MIKAIPPNRVAIRIVDIKARPTARPPVDGRSRRNGAMAQNSNPCTISAAASQTGIHDAMPPAYMAQAMTTASNRRTGACLARSLALHARIGPMESRDIMSPSLPRP